MENNIEILNEGNYLHCDNTECNYDLTFEGEFRKELIGTLCPKCNSDMLTKEDFDSSIMLRELMKEMPNILNDLSKEDIEALNKLAIEQYPELENLNPEELAKMSIHIHDNKLNINIEKDENTRI